MVAPTIPVAADFFEGNFKDTIDIGIQEHLLGVPIHEELTALRNRVDIVELENTSLRAMIRTMETVETVTSNHERLARVEIKRQLASVHESHRQDREDFKRLKDFMISQYGYRS
nr:hypothetical protein [Tanacetum cinerariifolium]